MWSSVVLKMGLSSSMHCTINGAVHHAETHGAHRPRHVIVVVEVMVLLDIISNGEFVQAETFEPGATKWGLCRSPVRDTATINLGTSWSLSVAFEICVSSRFLALADISRDQGILLWSSVS